MYQIVIRLHEMKQQDKQLKKDQVGREIKEMDC